MQARLVEKHRQSEQYLNALRQRIRSNNEVREESLNEDSGRRRLKYRRQTKSSEAKVVDREVKDIIIKKKWKVDKENSQPVEAPRIIKGRRKSDGIIMNGQMEKYIVMGKR